MATESGGLVKRTPQQVQAANLLILQRSDDAVSEILATATHVVIYVFAPATKQWERKEVSFKRTPCECMVTERLSFILYMPHTPLSIECKPTHA
jgi:hypothetical protein